MSDKKRTMKATIREETLMVRETQKLEHIAEALKKEIEEIDKKDKEETGRFLIEKDKLEREIVEFNEKLLETERKAIEAIREAEEERSKKKEIREQLKIKREEYSVLRKQIGKLEESVEELLSHRDFLVEAKMNAEVTSNDENLTPEEKHKKIKEYVFTDEDNKLLTDPKFFINCLKALETRIYTQLGLSQELDAAINRLDKTFQELNESKEKEENRLMEEIKQLEEKINDMKIKTKDDYKAEKFSEETVLREQIEEIFRLVAQNKYAKNLSTSDMLAQIEDKFHDTLDQISNYPSEKVEPTIKMIVSAKERNYEAELKAAVEEKREERHRKALERALAPATKSRTTRKFQLVDKKKPMSVEHKEEMREIEKQSTSYLYDETL